MTFCFLILQPRPTRFYGGYYKSYFSCPSKTKDTAFEYNNPRFHRPAQAILSEKSAKNKRLRSPEFPLGSTNREFSSLLGGYSISSKRLFLVWFIPFLASRVRISRIYTLFVYTYFLPFSHLAPS